MPLTVTLELPDHLVPTVEEAAQQKGVSVDEFLRDALLALYSQEEWETGEVTEEERRYHHQTALSREDIWGSEADKCWDTWTP